MSPAAMTLTTPHNRLDLSVDTLTIVTRADQANDPRVTNDRDL